MRNAAGTPPPPLSAHLVSLFYPTRRNEKDDKQPCSWIDSYFKRRKNMFIWVTVIASQISVSSEDQAPQ